MDVTGHDGSDVKLKMGLPDEFSKLTIGKSLVVLHFGTQPEVIIPEITRKDDGSVEQIDFTLNSFSPVVVAIVDRMVKVTIENVRGGYLIAYSGDLWNINDGKRQPLTFVPIGETVEIPAGTKLTLQGVPVGDSQCDEILVSENGETPVSIDTYERAYEVQADETVFTGVFSEWIPDEGEGEYPDYRVRTSPDRFETGKIETQLKAFLLTEEESEGREVDVTDWKLSEDNYYDQFTLTPEGILESTEELEAGHYSLAVEFVHDGEPIYAWAEFMVGFDAAFSMYLGSVQEGSVSWIAEQYLHGGYFAKGTSFGDIKNELLFADWNPGLYGYEFAGWMSMTDNNPMKLVEDTDVLSDDLLAYARFKNADGRYYDPKIETLEESDEPVNPDEPVTPDKPSGGNSSSSDSSGGSGSTGTSDTMFGIWVQDEYGWKFLQTNGIYAAGQWGLIQGVWYLFGEDAYMKTGWNNWNERWYYLDETKGSSEGAMLVGWQLIKDKWYYLNPISDGTRGARLSNQWVGDYFLDVDGSWMEGRTK